MKVESLLSSVLSTHIPSWECAWFSKFPRVYDHLSLNALVCQRNPLHGSSSSPLDSLLNVSTLGPAWVAAGFSDHLMLLSSSAYHLYLFLPELRKCLKTVLRIKCENVLRLSQRIMQRKTYFRKYITFLVSHITFVSEGLYLLILLT